MTKTSKAPPIKRPPSKSENQWVSRTSETMQTVKLMVATPALANRP